MYSYQGKDEAECGSAALSQNQGSAVVFAGSGRIGQIRREIKIFLDSLKINNKKNQ